MRWILTLAALMFSLLILTISPKVLADDLFHDDGPGASRVDRLTHLYVNSNQPSPEYLRGWFTGRCYAVETPRYPFGALLVARLSENTGPDEGPIFPPADQRVHEFNVFGVGPDGLMSAATEWDSLTAEQIDFVRRAIHRGYLKRSRVVDFSRQIVDRQVNMVLSTRRYQDSSANNDFQGYWLTKMELLYDAGPYFAGQKMAMCYFFRRVNGR